MCLAAGVGVLCWRRIHRARDPEVLGWCHGTDCQRKGRVLTATLTENPSPPSEQQRPSLGNHDTKQCQAHLGSFTTAITRSQTAQKPFELISSVLRQRLLPPTPRPFPSTHMMQPKAVTVIRASRNVIKPQPMPKTKKKHPAIYVQENPARHPVARGHVDESQTLQPTIL